MSAHEVPTVSAVLAALKRMERERKTFTRLRRAAREFERKHRLETEDHDLPVFMEDGSPAPERIAKKWRQLELRWLNFKGDERSYAALLKAVERLDPQGDGWNWWFQPTHKRGGK
jgi:hypothetical protein